MRLRWRGLLVMLCALLASPVSADCQDLAPYRAVPAAAEGQWTLATFNLWRLRDTHRDAPLDDPLEPAVYQARLTALADYLIDTLRSPALVAVQEVESRAVLEALAKQVRAAGGPAYQARLLEGNDPSGMDVGLLYRPPVGVGSVRALFSAVQYDDHALFARPPLVVSVTAPLRFSLVIVHLRSARGLGEEPWVAEKRRRQARHLAAWLKARSGPLMVAGDFNTGPGSDLFSETWRLLRTVPLYNSFQRLPADERHTYVYRCQPEAPDHVLLSPALVSHLADVAISRGNAGRYRVLYGSHGTRVVSDHDVPVLYFGP